MMDFLLLLRELMLSFESSDRWLRRSQIKQSNGLHYKPVAPTEHNNTAHQIYLTACK